MTSRRVAHAVKYLILGQQISDLECRIKEDSGELESLKYAQSEIMTQHLGLVGSEIKDTIKQQIAER